MQRIKSSFLFFCPIWSEKNSCLPAENTWINKHTMICQPQSELNWLRHVFCTKITRKVYAWNQWGKIWQCNKTKEDCLNGLLPFMSFKTSMIFFLPWNTSRWRELWLICVNHFPFLIYGEDLDIQLNHPSTSVSHGRKKTMLIGRTEWWHSFHFYVNYS